MTATFGMHVRFTAQPGRGGRAEATRLVSAGGKGL
jgi:hypothetical protein